jgi:hypothetical protein
MRNIFWNVAGVFCVGVLVFGGVQFKKNKSEITRNYEFLKAPQEFSSKNILNTSSYAPESTELTEGQILFFLDVTEEMNEASQNAFIGNLQIRAENHFEDVEFLKNVRRDAQDEAFSVLREKLNLKYMSLDEYKYIRNRVLAGMGLREPKSLKKVSAFKNTAADVFNLDISQASFKKIISETKTIELLDSEKNLVKDFKSRIAPNLLPILAGFDEVSGTDRIEGNTNDISLKN